MDVLAAFPEKPFTVEAPVVHAGGTALFFGGAGHYADGDFGDVRVGRADLGG